MKLRTFPVSLLIATLVGIAQTYFLLFTWNYINAYYSLATPLLAAGLRGNPLYAVSFLLGFTITSVLSLPAAFLLTKLRPLKLTAYLLCAVVPSFLWSNYALLGNSLWLSSIGLFVLGWVTQLFALPFAAWLLLKTTTPSAPTQTQRSQRCIQVNECLCLTIRSSGPLRRVAVLSGRGQQRPLNSSVRAHD